ncbi:MULTISPECIES: gp53-like domain-containing protein [Providencia]|uniref:gp53-like domain-containing protein n=1 Tax=Providencia TaxID=586 RepID=UPI00234A03E9|nr:MULTISPECIES: hypothetical protein [Providencia]MDK7745231.1 hypothetical protein [Providencia rettgeri]MDK7757687.1 hypothetical protein [Providencia rettgeri]
MTKIFKVPFATQGDRTSIPDDVQADGAVSYTQGYSYDYERDQQTDPAAKDIEREKMNGMFHDITEAIGELQSFGFPKWAVEGKPYPIRAIVYHKNKTWQSKIENNNVEPVAGTAWQELKADLSAGDINVYTKAESDKRFQPLGNYLPAGYSYSKAESDTKYQSKGNYAPAGNYALKGESYTKVEGDGRYQPKGSYQPLGDYALKGDSYTKAETDGKYQPKGSYQAAGYSYSKAESDTNYQPKGNYAPAGNYALKGDSYTKAEGDTRYQAKGSYQPSGDYALKGDSYTKAETDNKYQPKGSYQAAGYSYSKAESDTKYQLKGNYAPAGNYALKGESYTKAEGDTRYQPKGSYQPSGNYALKGDSYTKSESYSKAEVDSRVNAKGGKNTALKAANGWCKCGDTGLIYQWGRITAVKNTFPIAFPNAITSLVMSPTSGTLSSQRIGFWDKTRFEATFEYGNNTGFYFAVGY